MEEIRKYMQHQSVRNILFVHDVDSNDLPAIYQHASVFIYPSFIEGFGIPVLEAITSGIPAVVSKIGCLTERGGEGALYINPLDTEEIAEALNQVLLDSGLRAQLINEGRKHAEKFTDEAISKNLMNVYQSLF
jgi:glycosyltransferase involved in cell wall biosynthesis